MKTLRSLSAAFALALSAGTALAMPVLKAEITVTGEIVTVGDMFDAAGELASRPLFRAPRPGTTGTVELGAVSAAATRAGITAFDANDLISTRVSRVGSLVDQPLLTTLIIEDLKRRGILTTAMSATVLPATQLQPIRTVFSDAPAHLDNLRYLPGNGTFTARFSIEGLDRPLDISGTIQMSIEAPHLVATLSAGTVIGPGDVVMRPVPVQQADAQGFASLEQLIGMSLNRQSREGMLLRASDVSEPLAVAKNDIVTIFYRQGPMTLTVKGQAVTSAAEGAPMQVLNLVSKRVISATAIAPGAVEVVSAPLTMAGL